MAPQKHRHQALPDPDPGSRLTKVPQGGAGPAPFPTRVEIAAGGHQVVVESGDPLAVVARRALDLWRATDSPNGVRGHSTTVGFASELAGGPLPPDLTLPDRLIPGGDDDHRR